ncbi:alpha/beta hydrolase [Leucobacter muris]|uniref:alpha/beta hydrolase n=1 Tax=Leucobacter muris TaxID=1935379 RepID=UPI001E542FEE|nr:alpha/beta hydrolase [Leucobacter muris]
MALSLADFYYDRVGGEYVSNSTEAFSAINCLDYPGGELDRERMRAEAAELDKIAPTIGRFQGFGDVSCAEWPVQGAADRQPVRAAGAEPILVVGTTGDPATPYRWAESLADQLESGVLVTYRGEGHTAYGGNACVDDVVNAYLLQGVVPAQDPLCS